MSALSVTCWGLKRKRERERAVLIETCLLARASYRLMLAGVNRRLFVFESLKGKSKPLAANCTSLFSVSLCVVCCTVLTSFSWSKSKRKIGKRKFLCCAEIWIWYIRLPWVLLKFHLGNVTLKCLWSRGYFTLASFCSVHSAGQSENVINMSNKLDLKIKMFS